MTPIAAPTLTIPSPALAMPQIGSSAASDAFLAVFSLAQNDIVDAPVLPLTEDDAATVECAAGDLSAVSAPEFAIPLPATKVEGPRPEGLALPQVPCPETHHPAASVIMVRPGGVQADRSVETSVAVQPIAQPLAGQTDIPTLANDHPAMARPQGCEAPEQSADSGSFTSPEPVMQPLAISPQPLPKDDAPRLRPLSETEVAPRPAPLPAPDLPQSTEIPAIRAKVLSESAIEKAVVPVTAPAMRQEQAPADAGISRSAQPPRVHTPHDTAARGPQRQKDDIAQVGVTFSLPRPQALREAEITVAVAAAIPSTMQIVGATKVVEQRGLAFMPAPTQTEPPPDVQQTPKLAVPAALALSSVAQPLALPIIHGDQPIAHPLPNLTTAPTAAESAFATRIGKTAHVADAIKGGDAQNVAALLPLLSPFPDTAAPSAILQTANNPPTVMRPTATDAAETVGKSLPFFPAIPPEPPLPMMLAEASTGLLTQPRPLRGSDVPTPIMSTTSPPPVTVAALPQMIGDIVTARPESPVEIRLDPVELGAIQLTLHATDKDIRVVVAVERPDTLDLLRKHADQFLADLRQSGYVGTSLTFNLSDQQGPPQRHHLPIPQVELEHLPPPPQPHQPTSRSSGLDMRL